MSGALTPSEHVSRAQRHGKVGKALSSAGDEWAAVCLFYSAYHVVRAALLTDPVFSDLDALKPFDSRLIPDDRSASAHQMRRGSERAFGVNDLVGLVYPPIRTAYLELHGQSVGVRYLRGTDVPLRDLGDDLSEIEDYLIGGSADRQRRLREISAESPSGAA